MVTIKFESDIHVRLHEFIKEITYRYGINNYYHFRHQRNGIRNGQDYRTATVVGIKTGHNKNRNHTLLFKAIKGLESGASKKWQHFNFLSVTFKLHFNDDSMYNKQWIQPSIDVIWWNRINKWCITSNHIFQLLENVYMSANCIWETLDLNSDTHRYFVVCFIILVMQLKETSINWEAHVST